MCNYFSAPMPQLPDVDANAVVDNPAGININDNEYQMGLIEREIIVGNYFQLQV